MGLGLVRDHSLLRAHEVNFFEQLLMRLQLTMFLFSSFVILGNAHAEPVCSIAPEKKEFIVRVLCGEFSRGADAAYRFDGPNCIEQSARKRFEDSAIQVQMYRLCGDEEFANRLTSGNLKVTQFIQVLSVCTNERINLNEMFNERMDYVSTRLGDTSCDASSRQMMASRREFFENQMELAERSNINESIYEKLGITVDDAGNIFDK